MLVSYRRAENSGRINFFSKNKIAFLANIYMFKVSNKNNRKRCEICSKLTIKTPDQWRRSGIFINFERFTPFSIVFYCYFEQVNVSWVNQIFQKVRIDSWTVFCWFHFVYWQKHRKYVGCTVLQKFIMLDITELHWIFKEKDLHPLLSSKSYDI